MDGGDRDKDLPRVTPPSKFSVYQNPTLSAALTATSLRPSKLVFICLFLASSTSAYALLRVVSREHDLVGDLKFRKFSSEAVYVFDKAVQLVAALVFIGTLIALIKAIFLRRVRGTPNPLFASPKKINSQTFLTSRQLGLMGIKPRVEEAVSENSKKPTNSKDILFPVHLPTTISNRSSRTGTDMLNSSGESSIHSHCTPSMSPGFASSLYLVPTSSPQLYSAQTSQSLDQLTSTPWSNKQSSATKEITTEEMLEEFLEEVGEKITDSAGKLATPPPTINGFGAASPSTISSSANTSGTSRSTPLRPVRMSPSSQKLVTPPKKREGEFPQPFSIEESIKAFEKLGIYPKIEQWRDRLRQWFSSVLMNPLLTKIENSHIQVMQTAAKLGISITVSHLGSDAAATGAPVVAASVIDRTREWQPTFTLNEEELLHQLRATLVQALEASLAKLQMVNFQQSPQQHYLVSTIQECVDAISEHQRLFALMKGEWVKGLLPQSSVRANYMVQRIRVLAEGTCVKNYEYLGSGGVSDKMNKNWSLELLTDSHLLLYLFCAFLEHPGWMLHVDPVSHAGGQSSKNPLFLGVLPLKERFPEKYVAVMANVPSALHPNAFVLVAGRQCPPIFALYWDKQLQFCLTGRSALWDSILLMCHWIVVNCGGIVHGMHLGSSALAILSVLDSDPDSHFT